MSFLSALFGGQNPTLNKNIQNFGQIGGFATGTGENDINAASNFMRTLLSGDMSKITQLLAPQTRAIQSQGAQIKKNAAEFGGRSGGTNAATMSVADNSRSQVNDMISTLTGGAASSLGTMGTSLLNTGLTSYDMQDQASQQRMQNWMNSILGKGINGAINYAESFLPIPHGG